ncbi:hypothetical protein BG004_001605 [Podila humilis]|nr:hypothetical protein BG004_001605 [Podila humilis]
MSNASQQPSGLPNADPQPQIKQEPYQSPPQAHQSQYQYSSYPQQQSSSSAVQGHGHGQAQTYSGAASPVPFQALPPNPYSLASHLMNMNVQGGAGSGPSSSGIMGVNSVHHSGSTTPAMGSTNPLTNASAPSSPVMGHVQFNHYNNNSGSGLYSQQTHQQYSNENNNGNNNQASTLSSGFYNNSPPHQHQEQQQQQQSQYHPHQNQSQSHQQQGSSSSYGQFNANSTAQSSSSSSSSSTAPTTLRQQYAPLVPPLTDAQYQQYQQLLGSPFSSAASTPYHSNQSTPYSSMPASPTLEYQQLPNGGTMTPKPKRRQVKNACVNCQKACKKCDEGRPCTRCIKYGLTDTCVDSTRKVRKKGVKRGPYKRRPPPSQLGGSASASTTPVLTHTVVTGPAGYMSEPVTALNSPTQSHMLPFTSSAMGPIPGSALDFGGGYDGSSSVSVGYPFQQRMENSYVPPPQYGNSNYGVPTLYSTPYLSGSNSGNNNNNNNNNNSSSNNSNMS